MPDLVRCFLLSPVSSLQLVSLCLLPFMHTEQYSSLGALFKCHQPWWSLPSCLCQKQPLLPSPFSRGTLFTLSYNIHVHYLPYCKFSEGKITSLKKKILSFPLIYTQHYKCFWIKSSHSLISSLKESFLKKKPGQFYILYILSKIILIV